jgi:hypothetical protein
MTQKLVARLDEHSLLAIHESERLPALLAGPQVLNRSVTIGVGREGHGKSSFQDLMHVRRPRVGHFFSVLIAMRSGMVAHFPFGPLGSTVSGRQAYKSAFLSVARPILGGQEFGGQIADDRHRQGWIGAQEMVESVGGDHHQRDRIGRHSRGRAGCLTEQS